MDREVVLSKYKKPEDKLLISRVFDKIDFTNKTNKISTTDFYNESEQAILKNVIRAIEFNNYVFYGGNENSERKLLVIYPDKMKELFLSNIFKFDTVVSVFRIIIPKESRDKFNHSMYLGGLIKLGINRAKIGDIVVFNEGADIIVKKETDKFLYANMQTLTRFSNADISEISVDDITKKEPQFKDIKLITSSLRLDNIVSELARTSRNKAVEILNQERVFVNYINETKATKLIKQEDVISIRGKGKFIIDEVTKNSKNERFVVLVKQYK